MTAMTRAWDVFCRVIDNHGDLGVSWRMSADLAARGERARLWVDDASALAWMAPGGRDGVQVIPWSDPAPDLAPADVVIECFGCDPPARFVQRMAAMHPAPVWINLEYLSAEPYAERSHGLPSPVQVTPDRLLEKRFHFPGFTAASGGLLREPDLQGARRDFDRDAWLRAQRIEPLRGERLVSLFCYANAALPALLGALASEPTLLLVTAGAAADEVDRALDAGLRRSALRVHKLPYLTLQDYDRLLWSCDLNFVRGEDSFVRAQWAGRPFVWQAYAQTDAAHLTKVDAFLDRFLAGADPGLDGPLRRLFHAWNASPGPFLSHGDAWPEASAWTAHCEAWREALCGQADLVTQLLRHVAQSR